MVWEKLKEELIIPGLEAKSSDDIFEALGGKLVKQGYCGGSRGKRKLCAGFKRS